MIGRWAVILSVGFLVACKRPPETAEVGQLCASCSANCLKDVGLDNLKSRPTQNLYDLLDSYRFCIDDLTSEQRTRSEILINSELAARNDAVGAYNLAYVYRDKFHDKKKSIANAKLALRLGNREAQYILDEWELEAHPLKPPP